MSVFSDNLNKIMDERGISQKWLADAADTTEATISRYANGVHKPNIDIIVKIAKALSVSIDYLMGLTVIPNGEPNANAEELLIVRCYRRASDRDRRLIWSVMQEYLRSPQEEAFVSQLHSEKQSM